MKSMKRILSALVALTLVASTVVGSGILTVAASGNNAPTAPTNTKIELLEEAYGIDTKNPSFSWVVNDPDKNEFQTAYRILINDVKGDVKDTGWQTSSENTYVKVDGLEEVLKDNSLYYFQVQTKDKDNAQSPLSEPQAFTTAVGDNEWASKDGIWYEAPAATDPYLENGWTDYTVEADLNIATTALGVVFRAKDNSNFYMWQFNATNNTFNPHKWVNGTPAQIQSVSIPATAKIALNSTFRVKIQSIGQIVTTFIDNTGTGTNFVQIDQRDMSKQGGFTYGPVGFRTGNSESGTVDNLNVYATDETGTQSKDLYTADFSENKSYFPSCTVSNGALNLPKGIVSRMTGLYPEGEKQLANFVFLRNEFEIENKADVEKAVVSVTAKSPNAARQFVYNLYMNGTFVGLGPARAEKQNTIFYNTYDVTELLQTGTNAIGALNYTQSEKSFLCQMTVYYVDGSSEVLVNSGRDADQWQALDGTKIYGDKGAGNSIGTSYFNANAQNIDANLYPFGWDQPGFDASTWSKSTNKGNIVGNYKLAPYTSENTDRFLTDAAKVVDKGNGNYFIDLGKEIVGGIHLDVDSPVSQQITMLYGEELSSANTVKWQMRTGNNYREYWTLKKGPQVLENTGMMAFRYVEILNSPVEITVDNIKGLAMRQTFDDNKSSFSSSDPVLNDIYDFMKYSIKATNQDLMVDSQSRERGAYEGDVLINMLSSYAFEDNYSLSRYSIEYFNYNRTWPAEYVLYSIIMSWLDYQYTGNIDSLKQSYTILQDKMKTYKFDANVGLVKRSNGDVNRWDSVLVDWPVSEQNGYDTANSEYNTVLNAVSYGAYTDMAKIAEAIGEDPTAYQETADTIKETMVEKLYNQDKGAYSDGLKKDGTRIENYAQHGTAYALAYGVYDSQEMADKLADYIRQNGKINMSVYGSFFLLQGLYRAGAGDVAMDLIANPDASQGTRSWAYMMYTMGATISAEAWNTANKGNMTFSHPWGSAPASQIVRGMFGIQPIDPGFDTFQIKFQPGDVKTATIKTPSIKGSIEASYNTESTGSLIATTVHIPVNTRAQVSLPAENAGHDYLIVDGVSTHATREGCYLTIELGSGTHAVSVPATAKPIVSVADADNLFVGNQGKLDIVVNDADGNAMDLTDTKIVYTSSNESVATIAQDGTISYVADGSTSITASITFPKLIIGGTDQEIQNVTVQASTTINVRTAKINDVQIKLGYDATQGELHVGDTTTAQLVGTLESGKEIVFSEVTFTVGEDALTVGADGNITGVSEVKDALLTATTNQYFVQLANNFDIARFTLVPFYTDNFDNGNSTFGKLPVKNGKLEVGNGQKVLFENNDAKQWTDYTITGKFTVNAVAANITFRAQDSSNFYLWQFRTDTKTLKTHVFDSSKGYAEGFKQFAEVPINNIKPVGEENEFMIVVEQDKFSTYLNGELVDVTYDDTFSKGTIGVRNGRSESFLLDDLSVNNRTLNTTRTINVEKRTNKTMLGLVIDKAQEAVDSGEVGNAISSVQKSFHKAFDNAKAIYARQESTQVQINDATFTMIDEMHKLGFIAGDKTDLQELYNICVAIDTDLYESGAAKDAFKQAILDAKEVLDADEALQGDVTTAYNALQTAFGSLVKLDKTSLKSVLNKAAEVLAISDKYVQGAAWDAFVTANDVAIAIRDKVDTTNAEITQAMEQLMNAMFELRFKAEKGILDSLIQQAKDTDLSEYTPESVAAYQAVVAQAQAILDDDTLSESDQSTVDAMIDKLKTARTNLVANADNAGDSTEDTSSSENSKPDSDISADGGTNSTDHTTNPVAATGENNTIMYVVILLVAAAIVGVVFIIVQKRKK